MSIARIDLLDDLTGSCFRAPTACGISWTGATSAGRDLRVLGKIKIAAIGPGTADKLSRYHLKADVRARRVPCRIAGSRVGRRRAANDSCSIRASRGREILAEELTKAGGNVEQVVVYESVDVEQPIAEIAARMAAGQIHWTTVTSSAIARSLVRMFGESLHKTKLVSISPITSATLHELDMSPPPKRRNTRWLALSKRFAPALADEQ